MTLAIDLGRYTPGMTDLQDSVEQRVARNAPRLLLLSLVVAVAASIGVRVTRHVNSPWVERLADPVMGSIQTFAVLCAIMFFGTFVCAVTSLLLRRVLGDLSRRTVHRVMALVVGVALLAFFFFVPMCFGSLNEGTYECITLFRRATSFVAGG